eukprot:TRINITY_DN6602_c0_g1_i2.p1 TRINITY_DN6602_c0_g1~~TRINITY_DN6602_c0_g1_i2.p1  ORF type:complete len:485 (-),score=97.78 TRINITY_DN6602_c0_g1_i2:68-1522(-)
MSSSNHNENTPLIYSKGSLNAASPIIANTPSRRPSPYISNNSPILASPLLSESLGLISGTPQRRRRGPRPAIPEPDWPSSGSPAIPSSSSLGGNGIPRRRTEPQFLTPQQGARGSVDPQYGPSPAKIPEDQRSLISSSDDEVDGQQSDTFKGISSLQATLNAINGLVGVGLLAFPFAFKQGGWIGAGAVLILLCSITCYTAVILGKCIESRDDIYTFTDIGNAAYGPRMELFIGLVIFLELFTSMSSYIILEADNLSHVLPDVALSHRGWMILVTFIILPTTWIRDLSKLSYFSVIGIMASVSLFLSVIYIAIIQGQLAHPASTVSLNLKGVPVSLGLIMFGFSGHALFPGIYDSMENKKSYGKMLAACYLVTSIIYAGMSVLGYLLYGDYTQQEITLNFDRGSALSQLAIWLTIINPFSKAALMINPGNTNIRFTLAYAESKICVVCLNLEALIIPLNTQGLKRDVLRIVIRTFTTTRNRKSL